MLRGGEEVEAILAALEGLPKLPKKFKLLTTPSNATRENNKKFIRQLKNSKTSVGKSSLTRRLFWLCLSFSLLLLLLGKGKTNVLVHNRK